MIPAEFDYVAPDSLDGVLRALSDGGEDAKLLAGGHCSYEYLGSEAMGMHQLTDDVVLAIEYPHHHGNDFEVNVLFGNFQVRHMTGGTSKQIFDAIARGERPVRHSPNQGELMRKFPKQR